MFRNCIKGRRMCRLPRMSTAIHKTTSLKIESLKIRRGLKWFCEDKVSHLFLFVTELLLQHCAAICLSGFYPARREVDVVSRIHSIDICRQVPQKVHD